MELLYAKGNFSIYADAQDMTACIVRGEARIMLDLEPLVPLSPLEAKNLRLLGQNPANYLHIGHSCHIIPRDAAPAWEELLARAEANRRAQDTSMIPRFRLHLPGLGEVRDMEEMLESVPGTLSLHLENNESLITVRIQEVRRRYPRESLYLQAERLAMGPDARRAAAARRLLAALICGRELPERDLILLNDNAPQEPQRPARVPARLP